jgi:hypothetical protein
MDSEIIVFFNQNGISDLRGENLKKEFLDNLLFKRLLRILVLRKLRAWFKEPISSSNQIDNFFPRNKRKAIISEIESGTGLVFPETRLSNVRGMFLAMSIITTAVLLVATFFFKVEFFLVPMSVIGLPIYLFVCTLPALVISMVNPTFFFPLDWEGIKTVDDLLDSLVVRNWKRYYEDNFALAMAELTNP